MSGERALSGVFADVSLDAQGIVWIARETVARDAIVLARDGIDQGSILGQQAQAMFPRLDAAGPVPAVTCQSGRYVAVAVGDQVWTFPQLGPVFATYPCAIRWNGVGTLKGWLLATITSRPQPTLTLSRLDQTGQLTERATGAANTSQGIFSLDVDGMITLTDFAPRLPGVGKLWTAGGLTVGEGSNPDHLWGQLNGQVFRIADGFAAEPRCVQRPDGTYVVVARGLHGKVRVIEGPPWLVSVPVPSQPAPLPSTIAQVGRPAIWAYWKHVDLLAPGNAILIERQADLVLILTEEEDPTSKPLIILRPMLPSCWQYWDRVYAVLIHEEGGQAKVEAQARLAILAMQAAGVPKRPVMSYTGKNLHPAAKGVDIHGIQAYLAPDTPNPAHAMAKRIRADAAQFGPKQKLVLHGQAYDRRTYNDPTRKPANTSEGWTDVEGLKALQTVYPAMLNADSRMVGCLWFHDGQRQGGTRDYPELIPYHARCVAVTPGPPAIPVIVSPPPPTDPDPPVDDEEEPTVPTPVKFPPMSDAELQALGDAVDQDYDVIWPNREPRQTRADALAYGRWFKDYFVARARGEAPGPALVTMRKAMYKAGREAGSTTVPPDPQ